MRYVSVTRGINTVENNIDFVSSSIYLWFVN